MHNNMINTHLIKKQKPLLLRKNIPIYPKFLHNIFSFISKPHGNFVRIALDIAPITQTVPPRTTPTVDDRSKISSGKVNYRHKKANVRLG